VQALLNQTVEDDHSHPAQAPYGWWKSVPVSRIFVGVGGDEILLDPILQTAEKIKVSFTPVRGFKV
jgi:hypothetical protein